MIYRVCIVFNMPKRCAVRGCSRTNADGVSLYSFPRENVELCEEWVQFVKVKRSDFLWPSHTSVVCSLHFKASSFEHNIKEVLGIKCRLRLVDGAVPTIQISERKKVYEENESNKEKGCESEAEELFASEESVEKGTQVAVQEHEPPFECNVEIVVDENASFNNANLYSQVSNLLDLKSSYKCKECGEEFTKNRKFVQHIISHSNIQAKNIEEKEKSVDTSNSDWVLSSHVTHPLDKESYKCNDCGEEFMHKGKLVQHLLSHSSEQVIDNKDSEGVLDEESDDCAQSEVVLSQNKALIQQMLSHSGTSPIQPVQENVDVQPFQPTPEGSDSHATQPLLDPSNVQLSHKCNVCGKVFSRRSNLNQHLLKHTGVRPHNCNECGKQFFQRRDLTRHMVTHTGYQPYTCSECGKSFSHKGDLTRHTMNHTGYQPYKCEVCGKTFSRRHDSEKHMFVHTDERPYKCAECGKGFSQRSRLAQHALNHTGERPHKCTECGKAYLTKLSLTRHMPVHTGYKPFTCEECSKAFYRKDDLAKHMLVHTGNLPYSCMECGKMFARKQTLTVHMLTHSGERPHHCNECDATYKYKVDLTNHLKKKHNVRNSQRNLSTNEHISVMSYEGQREEMPTTDYSHEDPRSEEENVNHPFESIIRNKEQISGYLDEGHQSREENLNQLHDNHVTDKSLKLKAVDSCAIVKTEEKMEWESSSVDRNSAAVWSASGLMVKEEEQNDSNIKVEPIDF